MEITSIICAWKQSYLLEQNNNREAVSSMSHCSERDSKYQIGKDNNLFKVGSFGEISIFPCHVDSTRLWYNNFTSSLRIVTIKKPVYLNISV